MRSVIYSILIALGLCLLPCSTSLAAPTQMPDGSTFDPVYYAQANPDVAAACGTGIDMLYYHYVNFGQKEGRLPYQGSGTVSTSKTPGKNMGYKFNLVTNAPDNFAGLLAELIDWKRVENDRDYLKWNDDLAAAAQIRVNEIAGNYSHVRTGGDTAYMAFPGWVGASRGELISQGYGDPMDVLRSWENPEESYILTIMNEYYRYIGAAYYYDENKPMRNYWVVLFAG